MFSPYNHDGWSSKDKPLPHIPPLPQLPPSPTLTNPDHILPDFGGVGGVDSPPPTIQQPPSPSYLRDHGARGRSSDDHHLYMQKPSTMGKKEKLGLMNRKMLLLRNRTASDAHLTSHSHSHANLRSQASFESSSSVHHHHHHHHDVGNLASEPSGPTHLQPPRSDRRTASNSSSSGLSGMTGFLDRYEKQHGASDDDALYDDSEPATSPAKFDDTRSVDTEMELDMDAQRRRQEQEEYESAILSKRAERILANAKKRLNVMEGNLRGARDLVAPLTTANLKRATSLSGVYGSNRSLQQAYGYDDEQTQSSPRMLHSQASFPNVRNNFQGQNQAWIESLPNRPYTSLDRHPHQLTLPKNLRAPGKASRPTQATSLRSTRSHDYLGTGAGHSLHYGPSPDSNSDYLEPLQEDEDGRWQRGSTHGYSSSVNNGLGIYRPVSRTSDLRDQMSSLKGRISNLKDKARADSLRRQSQLNVQDVSPFNNASTASLDMFSPTSHSPKLGSAPTTMSWTSHEHGPPRRIASPNGSPITGARNAFAEAALTQKQPLLHARVIEVRPSRTSDGKRHATTTSRRRGYSHRQSSPSQSSQSTLEAPRLQGDNCLDVPSPDFTDEEYAPSEVDPSVYEDAQEDNSFVPHEDREDAFDYEHFFLHSALGSYAKGRRSSDASTISTARGPLLGDDDDDDGFDQASCDDLPPAPETPERLREIERNLHRRTFSDESVKTSNTFATAEEDPVSPVDGRAGSRLSFPDDSRVVSPVEAPLHDPCSQSLHSAHNSVSTQRAAISRQTTFRPILAVKSQTLRRDSLSDRADSGVSIAGRSEPRRPHTALAAYKHSGNPSTSSAISTPPASPRDVVAKQDPTTVAVQALLDPTGKPLGLRNKAVLFGVVESLRKVVRQLQEEEDMTFTSRMLRNTLDEAKRTLDGL